MKRKPQTTLDALLADDAGLDACVRKAIRDAVVGHVRLGQPLAVYGRGKVAWVHPRPTARRKPA